MPAKSVYNAANREAALCVATQTILFIRRNLLACSCPTSVYRR